MDKCEKCIVAFCKVASVSLEILGLGFYTAWMISGSTDIRWGVIAIGTGVIGHVVYPKD